MLGALTKIFECIVYYSSEKNNSFNEKPRFDADIKEKASHLPASCFKKNKSKVIFTPKEPKFSKKIISLNDPLCFKNCRCSCLGFMKWAVCVHVVAYSIHNKTDWYGIKYRQKEKFDRNKKK